MVHHPLGREATLLPRMLTNTFQQRSHATQQPRTGIAATEDLLERSVPREHERVVGADVARPAALQRRNAVVLMRPALPRRRLTLGDELEDLGARVAMLLGLRAAGWPEPLERRAELLRCTNGRRA